MRPPVCAICRKDFRKEPDKGGGVYFALSDADKAYNIRFENPDYVGHPAGYEWFCDKHLKRAKKYSNLTLIDALERMNKDLTLIQKIIRFIRKY